MVCCVSAARLYSLMIVLFLLILLDFIVGITHQLHEVHIISVTSIESFEKSLLLEDERGTHFYLRYKTTLEPTVLGEIVDQFVVIRPWWRVVDLDSPDLNLARAPSDLVPVFKAISMTQNPADCRKSPIRIKTLGMDSYGNSAFDFTMEKFWDFPVIFVPYITFPDYLDPKDCPNGGNYWECTFLPATKCRDYPQPLRQGLFESATPTSSELVDERKKAHIFHHLNSLVPSYKKSIIDLNIHGDYFVTGKTVLDSVPYSVDELLFTFGYLFRMHSSFRSMVKKEMQNLKSRNHNNTFPDNGDCVAIHIRRSHDRALPGVDMDEWCRRFHQDGDKWLAWDFQQNIWVEEHSFKLFNFGCDMGMPYGSITLEQYLNASQIISTSKNIYIRTDNPKWLDQEFQNNPTLQSRYNIFTSHVYDNHRKGSIRNAASYFAAIEIARKCSAFVGHRGSAVTEFWLRHLCTYSNGKFGICPAHYDFQRGPKSWQENKS
jgi:hypothetical protein